MRKTMLREITDDEMQTFWRDGVVCLRSVVDKEWLEYLVEPIEQLIAHPEGVDLAEKARKFRQRSATGGSISDPLFGEVAPGELLEDKVAASAAVKAKFVAFTHVYPVSEPIRRFETESMLPEIAAKLMRSNKVHLFIDQLFVKEPGTPTRTAFHVDESYFNVTGEQVCTMWLSLDRATKNSSTMGYVPGSHCWSERFAPNNFISQKSLRNQTDRVRLPDIEADPDNFGVVYFDVDPGDVIVHHYRTVHGSGGNTTMNRRRRALSIRYTGDDVRWGPAARAGERLRHDLHEGDPLDKAEEVFPTCWG